MTYHDKRVVNYWIPNLHFGSDLPLILQFNADEFGDTKSPSPCHPGCHRFSAMPWRELIDSGRNRLVRYPRFLHLTVAFSIAERGNAVRPIRSQIVAGAAKKRASCFWRVNPATKFLPFAIHPSNSSYLNTLSDIFIVTALVWGEYFHGSDLRSQSSSFQVNEASALKNYSKMSHMFRVINLP